MARPLPFDDSAVDAIGAGLPASALIDPLRTALTREQVAVVAAPPGSGKTTLVPPVVAQLFADDGGRIVVTQPRRIAARAAAHRLAELTGTRVGELAGFTVRGERRMSAGAVVEFCTPGVLLRRLIADPALEGTSGVICDEVHERALDTDLVLAMAAELRELRPELALVAMSATVDAPRFAALLGGDGPPAQVLTSPATPHELRTMYAPAPVPRQDGRGVTDEYCRHIAQATAEALAEHLGDALVFLPGVREIERAAGHLEAVLRSRCADVEVLQLHGSLPAREQDRVLRPAEPGGRRRAIVASSVAESSLTVPGVRIVVDSCLSREPRLDAARGVSGLVTVSCSQDSAIQRAGRAARTADGVAIRAIAEADWSRLRTHRTPEIAAADLTPAALDLACWGTPRGEGLPLPDPPPRAAIGRAESALFAIGAVDDIGGATPLGRLLARVPADPRIARALLAAAASTPAAVDTAAEVTAALGDPPRRQDASLPAAIDELRAGRHPGAERWRREAERLAKLARSLSGDYAAATAGAGAHTHPVPALPPKGDVRVTGFVTALAFGERIARRVSPAGDSGRSAVFKLASGTQVLLAPGSGIENSEWIVVAEAGRVGERVLARLAAPLTEADALAAGHALLREDESTIFDGERLQARLVRRLGEIELSSTPTRPTQGPARRAIAEWIGAQDGNSGVIDWFDTVVGRDSSAASLRRRLACAREAFGDPWPDMSAAGLAAQAEEGLAQFVDDLAAGTAPARIDAASALRGLVPWPEAGRIDELVPERLSLPSGNSHRVRYPEPGSDERPAVSAKLQEFFGLAESPTVAGGRIPVTAELLSPAGRPLAVSTDLTFFWDNAYPGVRAEMRGRYPKHPWPENPWEATATAQTKRRSAKNS